VGIRTSEAAQGLDASQNEFRNVTTPVSFEPKRDK
jgi:hypothetical protein